jgi:hypothetical protein
VRVETDILDAASFDDDLKNDDIAKEAKWVLRAVFTFQPSPTAPVKQVSVYAAKDKTEQGYSGGFRTLVQLAPPFPAPFNLIGSFEMFRLETQAPSIWDRIFGIFSGCGRS